MSNALDQHLDFYEILQHVWHIDSADARAVHTIKADPEPSANLV